MKVTVKEAELPIRWNKDYVRHILIKLDNALIEKNVEDMHENLCELNHRVNGIIKSTKEEKPFPKLMRCKDTGWVALVQTNYEGRWLGVWLKYGGICQYQGTQFIFDNGDSFEDFDGSVTLENE